jgi:ABC-2 type transport system ATP-binding protein
VNPRHRTPGSGAAGGRTWLTKRFGAVTAVDDLGFSAGEGTVTAFLGPNGAGKTSTLRTLLGLVRPSSGSATINGRPHREVRSSVGASLEATGFHPGRTGHGHRGCVI